MDTCAGAYPIDPHDRIMEEMAWVFAPYADARTQGRVTHLNSAEMETIIDAVLDRISLYSIGQGQLQKPDIRYNVMAGGSDLSRKSGLTLARTCEPKAFALLFPIAARETVATSTLSAISPPVGSTYRFSIKSSIKSRAYRATTSGAEATTAVDPLASAAVFSVRRISPS